MSGSACVDCMVMFTCLVDFVYPRGGYGKGKGRGAF